MKDPLAKNSLEEVLELNALFQSILNTLDEAIYAIDRSKKVIYCNDNTEKLMHVKREDFVGKDYVNFLESIYNADKALASSQSMAMHTIEDGVERHVENYYLWQFTGEDGFEADVRATPLLGEAGEVKAVLVRIKKSRV